MSVNWIKDLICSAEWAFRQEDLRHQFIHAQKASDLQSVPGIAKCLETTLVLAIYEACLGKGFVDGKTIAYEKSYPGRHARKRADLALKDGGKGKNWGYVEVKRYSAGGDGIKKDVHKLRKIKIRAQRWVLIYRIRQKKGKKKFTTELKQLLEKHFKNDLKGIDKNYRSFETISKHETPGICEICLAKLKRR